MKSSPKATKATHNRIKTVAFVALAASLPALFRPGHNPHIQRAVARSSHKKSYIARV
jgi:hypothetical protein